MGKLDVSICHVFLLGMEDCIFKWSNVYIVLQSLIFKSIHLNLHI